MQKKLMAIAVAGALSVPAVALAQASTVQIYGLLKVEYGYADQPNDATGAARHNIDAQNSGAGSHIGFRGEEKLGGGISAWFQCESEMRFTHVTSTTAQGFCGRNTALGLKGGFGNVFFGKWDSPLKQAVGKTRMLNETGWMGAQHMLLTGEFMEFSERNPNSVNYVTPNFGGFMANAQYTTTNRAVDELSSVAEAKGRKVSLGGIYSGGPLVITAGWAKHDDNQSVGGAAGDEDTAWAIGATYTFGPVKAGLTYTDQELEVGPDSLKRKSWNAALDWRIAGPHMVRFGYTSAGDYKGSLGASDTGADQWQVGYHHFLSKRTNLGVSYVRVNNDSAGSYNLTGLSNDVLGDDASVFVFHMYHRF